MPNVTFSDALLLLNAGDWCLEGGHCGNSIAHGARLTSVTLEADTLRLECRHAVIEHKIDRAYVQVIGRDEPREIQITGPHMVRQQRKKIDGGGWHEVEQTGLLFRFRHSEAWPRFLAAQEKKREDARQQEADRKREDAKKRVEDARAQDKRERSILLPVSRSVSVQCFVLICDWKERHSSEEISEAIRLVFDGKNCPALTDVPDTQSDMHACVVSSTTINTRQAQTVWNLYMQNVRQAH